MSDAHVRRASGSVWLALALAGVIVGACKKNKESTDPAAGAAPPPDAAAAFDPLGEHERALADNAEKLRGFGVELDTADRTAREPEREAQDEDDGEQLAPKLKPNDKQAPPRAMAATRCEELCGLAGTACELRGHICELAEDHVGEPRYEDACWRANDQCDRASSACEDCRGTNAAG